MVYPPDLLSTKCVMLIKVKKAEMGISYSVNQIKIYLNAGTCTFFQCNLINTKSKH